MGVINKDIFNNIKVVSMTTPVATSADAESGACALAGYASAAFYVYMGADATPPDTATNLWSFRLLECATVGGSYTAVADADVIGATTNSFGIVNDAAEDNAVYGLGYKGSQPFVKVDIIETGAVSTILGVFAVLGHPSIAPTGQVVTP